MEEIHYVCVKNNLTNQRKQEREREREQEKERAGQ